ncbi:hypothetical protein GCM10023069_54740 [Shinella granuli]
MRVGLLSAAFAAMLCASASAQVTVCNGDVCTREIEGKEERLSDAEVGKLKRSNARTAIQSIECRHAADAARCDEAVSDLFGLFPY